MIVTDPWDAEDVLQTVLEKLIKKIPLLKTLEQHRRLHYICVACKNTAYNYCRDRADDMLLGESEDELLDSSISVENVVITNEILSLFIQVWDTLDEKTKYLLRGKYILNSSAKELAAELNMSVDSIRMALVRARRKARTAMENWSVQTSVE